MAESQNHTDRGSFGFKTLVGATTSDWPEGVYATPVMGLPVAGQHLFGAFEMNGRRSFVIRHFMNEVAVRMLAYESAIGEDFVYKKTRGYAGLCEMGQIDGRWGVYQPGNAPKFSFTSATDSVWVERGLLDVQLRPLPHALQLVTPDATEPLAYLARTFEVVGGTFDGQPIEHGFVSHEQVYLRSGQGWMLSRYKKQLQCAWVAFVNQYANGDVEHGSICLGNRGWTFAIVFPSGREPVLVDQPKGVARVVGDSLQFEADLGEHGTWVWTPLPEGGGRVPLPAGEEEAPVWSEGVLRRAGDERVITFAHSWAEWYPSRL